MLERRTDGQPPSMVPHLRDTWNRGRSTGTVLQITRIAYLELRGSVLRRAAACSASARYWRASVSYCCFLIGSVASLATRWHSSALRAVDVIARRSGHGLRALCPTILTRTLRIKLGISVPKLQDNRRARSRWSLPRVRSLEGSACRLGLSFFQNPLPVTRVQTLQWSH